MTRIELLAEAAKMGLKVSVPKTNKHPQLQAAGYLAYAATCGSGVANACPEDKVEFYVRKAKEALARIPSPTAA